jgi:hypothetical protein
MAALDHPAPTLTPLDRELIATCADLDARFELIRFVNPRLTQALKTFEMLRLSVRKARQLIAATGCKDGSRISGFPLLIQPVIAPSGSGKTANAIWYVNEVNALEHAHDGFSPAVYTELSEKTDSSRLWSDILRSLGHPYPEKGTERQRRDEVYNLLPRKGVELLILDEAHNILHREDGTIKLSVLDAIKHLANSGSCAIVLMGVERMTPFFTANAKEFKSRCRPFVVLTPLDRAIPKEWDLFLFHLAKLDLAMVEAGLTDAPSGLHSSHAELLYDASFYRRDPYHGAIIGDASKIVRFALEWMVYRVATNRSAVDPRIITEADLKAVIRNHVMPLHLGDEEGLRKRGFSRLVSEEKRHDGHAAS